jgi:nicotinate-nucleotide--dimethylbenzimidazole phosphoribosyltransferase
MVLNFLGGGAAINVFARQHGLSLKVVDAGVNYEFAADTPDLHQAKVAAGSQNFRYQPALTIQQLESCRQHALKLVNEVVSQTGCNVMGFGEMGIGNTSSASLLMHCLTGLPLAQCVGRGTGITNEQLTHKLSVLQAALDYHKLDKPEPYTMLQTFGGLEIAQMAYAMQQAAEQACLLLIDGFIATAAYLVAYSVKPEIARHAVFCHQSNEQGHRLMLEYLKAQPLLNLGLRLGEGTGCALAYPLVQAAVNFLNEMASFESAAVTNKTP